MSGKPKTALAKKGGAVRKKRVEEGNLVRAPQSIYDWSAGMTLDLGPGLEGQLVIVPEHLTRVGRIGAGTSRIGAGAKDPTAAVQVQVLSLEFDGRTELYGTPLPLAILSNGLNLGGRECGPGRKIVWKFRNEGPATVRIAVCMWGIAAPEGFLYGGLKYEIPGT